jgi:hypothetical protein
MMMMKIRTPPRPFISSPFLTRPVSKTDRFPFH